MRRAVPFKLELFVRLVWWWAWHPRATTVELRGEWRALLIGMLFERGELR